MEQVLHDLVGARQVDRAVRVGEAERLLLAQEVPAAHRVVLDVAARGLVGEPLADVALVGAGALGQLVRGHGFAVGHRLVEAELVAQAHHYPAVAG